MIVNSNIGGIILAGGKSSRIGQNKALLPFNGKNIIQNSIELLTQISKNIIISSNSELTFYYPQIKDSIENIGPIEGIKNCLNYSICEYNIVLACDLPFISVELLHFLLTEIKNYDIIIPSHFNKIEPLCGIYKKNVASEFEKNIELKNYSVINAIRKTNYKIIEIEFQSFYNENLFFNINTINDYQNLIDLTQ